MSPLILLVALVLLYLVVQAFLKLDAKRLLAGFRWLAILAGVGVGMLLLLSGRLPQLLPFLPLLLPLLIPVYRRWQSRFGTATPPPPGQRSGVETDSLSMWLDHDSNTMGGSVRGGPQAGRDLAELELPDLLSLRSSLQDAQSVSLLDAYLDRRFPDWRNDGESSPPPFTGGDAVLSVDEARAILGLTADATPDEVRAAHRRLMRQNHPDHGGTNWLATRINEARDVLLR